MSDIWDNEKAKRQRRHRERLSGGQAGKGDAPRNNTSEAYRLGALLMELGQEHPDYDSTLKAWRNAVKKGL
jgi:hypothetical protein